MIGDGVDVLINEELLDDLIILVFFFSLIFLIIKAGVNC
jgi:hypothetical protein